MYIPKPSSWNLMSKEGKKLWELTEGIKKAKELEEMAKDQKVVDEFIDNVKNGKVEETELPF